MPDQKQDPTLNVLHIVDLSVKRLDDLREAEARRVNEQLDLRDKHAGQLREAEAKRIDAKNDMLGKILAVLAVGIALYVALNK